MNKKKTALITGASRGIGYELARLFAQDSYNLVLVARDEEKLRRAASELEEKYNIYVKVIIKDLASSSSPEEIFAETEAEGLEINTLVNNAGFGVNGLFLETDIEKQLEMIQVNVTALTHLSYLYGKKMCSLGEGSIMNVSSTAAFQPGPLMSVYYASKAYVLSFSQALSNEFKKYNISVTTLCPGPTDTDFFKTAEMPGTRLAKGPYVMAAEDAAKDGYNALKSKKSVIIPGLTNKVAAFGSRMLPGKITAKFVRKIQERRRH